jgi:3-oxoacyl-[acyl-carrier-protein] synthase III
MRAQIVGTGSYSPAKILTNKDFEKMVDTTDQWIVERTGIRERHIAAPEEATSDLAYQASLKALEMAGVKAEDLDAILVGTVTPDFPFPSTACLVQGRLGNKKAFAADISAACAGSIFALSFADKLVSSGAAKYVLALGAETLTRITDWTDRNTCVLFGDGSGAMLLAPSSDDKRGVQSTHLHSDGSLWSILYQPGGGSRQPVSQKVVDEKLATVKMNGREVYKVAVRALVDCCKEALAANHMSASDVDMVIAHQANKRILDATLDRLGIPPEKCWMNLEKYGNTSSASVPTTLDEANRAGRLHPGDMILMMAIGGGMTWGSAVVRW